MAEGTRSQFGKEEGRVEEALNAESGEETEREACSCK